MRPRNCLRNRYSLYLNYGDYSGDERTRKERKNEQGASVIEFAFVALTLAPMLAGIGVTGVNLVRTLQTERLARDAGGYLRARSRLLGRR